MDAELILDEEMEPNARLNEITNRILAAAFDVHTELGPGYQEQIYGNALAMEFERRHIRFEREVSFQVLYKGQPVGMGKSDFIVEVASSWN
ncbi:MAG TPA: GxxExxY protein [Tepidisphaeraceae bacterium]|nr:GxxExxY protein [Tepidisphaeraceae bacterium]